MNTDPKVLHSGSWALSDSGSWTNVEQCRLQDVFNSSLWFIKLNVVQSIAQQLYCSATCSTEDLKIQLRIIIVLPVLLEGASTAIYIHITVCDVVTPLGHYQVSHNASKPTMMGLGATQQEITVHSIDINRCKYTEKLSLSTVILDVSIMVVLLMHSCNRCSCT